MKISALTRGGLLISLLVAGPSIFAQIAGPPPARASGPPPSAQQAARFDLTGYWVSVVSEDWRWRMLTAPTGDVEGLPLNPAGRQAAAQFDGTRYGTGFTNKIDCRAYYGAGLMRMPTRLHITWASPDVLQIESDWGQQTRRLYFRKADMPNSGPTPQGSSFAEWRLVQGFGAGLRAAVGASQEGGKLYVVTDQLTPGWLRRNGVPYSGQTRMTEWFHTFEDSAGNLWFSVSTKVEDPEYLFRSYMTSSEFRKEPDGSKWSPHPCVQM